ncbi:SrtB family sortase [Priestia taiwanensis]|uniref:SrtB family sortase n=1 Tax=Priestia taiwanensis TaxID=1347902 RepID=A0A917AXG1_9BACI|nr:class B sortase [Priestia taiwanensis]GGE79499.1 SrtB family sortase [Priestia taiwanensis]
MGIIYSVSSILVNMKYYHESAKVYEGIREVYTKQQYDSNSKLLENINQDYIGWLSIGDTEIDYPVVQSVDNNFYLSHNFYKNKDFAGAIFMDYRNIMDDLDKNVILYGHNMKDGSMFGSLKNYLDIDYYSLHKRIKLEFQDNDYEFEIFSVYTTTNTDWMNPHFSSQDQKNHLKQLENQSEVKTDVEVTEDDMILTLATCTVDDDERLIVHAKLMK